MKSFLLFVYLTVLAWEDMREKKVAVQLLAGGSVMGLGCRLSALMSGQGQWKWEIAAMCLAVLPGMFLILTARLTHKAGIGDGWTLVNVGLVETYKSCIFLLGISLVIMAVVSGGLLTAHRVNKGTKMPYLPFLTVAYLCKFLL